MPRAVHTHTLTYNVMYVRAHAHPLTHLKKMTDAKRHMATKRKKKGTPSAAYEARIALIKMIDSSY